MSTPYPPTDPQQQAAPASPIDEAARDLEAVLHEVKRVVIGQDAMLERVLVALLSGGHVLLEGVPGLAKTLTVKTLSTVLGGEFRRVQFTPDLVPADLVGNRIWRPDTGTFETQLGPVFGNLLLADEINRAPAKVQSALLEVMQERQVTLGGETFPLPSPFLVLATQNPIESEGTYPLPEAQVDRFLLKVVVGYPTVEDEASVVHASVGTHEEVRQIITPDRLLRHRQTVRSAHVDPQVVRFAVALADATRHPERYGLGDLQGAIDVGASPRGPIGLVQAAQALAVLRGRDYVTSRDVRALALDVLRHRLVLSYEAHADGLTPDDVLERVLRAVDPNAGEPAPLLAENQVPDDGDGRWTEPPSAGRPTERQARRDAEYGDR
ncbi:MoxR family ATPase [Patulibacter sp.]|uniref:AAA family ATPase n=1 Tax=Patulibacter sp. TaxID=1912859 RepID=UPI00271BCAFE|nr:MoxR family ATPase [Patulibacter sp.]MDO9406800.1 MoxR family ATPase [Patulibacter sp.]